MKGKRKRITGVLLSLTVLFSALTSFGTTALADIPAVQTWTGWIIDRDCAGVIPINHSKGCNLMGAEKTLPSEGCYSSGLGIYTKIDAPTESSSLKDYLVFDGPSKELAKTFLNSLPAAWKKNITVKVTGYTVDNIPAGGTAGQKGYEARVPETDPTQVTHYLSGIHVTKIEAVYIDGVSTNALPSPNTEVAAANTIGLSEQVSGSTSTIGGQNENFNLLLKDFSKVLQTLMTMELLILQILYCK